MVSSLTRRQRFALQAPSPDTATDHGAPSPDPIPQSPIGNHQLETSKLPNPQTPAQATLEPQPAPLSDLGGSVANPTPPIGNGQSEIDKPNPSPLCDLSAFAVNSSVPPPARNGKIARLPDDMRFQVNQMIRSGRSYSDITEKLAELGHPGITPANISNWKFGGFVDWLVEEQRSDRRLVFAQALDRCTRSVDIDRIQQNTIALAADKLAHIILDFDHKDAMALLSQRPELFPRFLAAIGTLTKSTVDLAKAFDLAQNREATIRSGSADIPVGSTVDTSAEETDDPADSVRQPTAPLPPALATLDGAEPPAKSTAPENPGPDFNRFKPILGDFRCLENQVEPGYLAPAPMNNSLSNCAANPEKVAV